MDMAASHGVALVVPLVEMLVQDSKRLRDKPHRGELLPSPRARPGPAEGLKCVPPGLPQAFQDVWAGASRLP